MPAAPSAMGTLDYVVLVGYFVALIAIGVICSLRIRVQEDFFMGGRGFGKLLQTFAAFGAGTGSSDPVNTGAQVYAGGMSGMWSVMYWLFVTPFYWITAVWYRRMRHLTLGDWFVERYESKALGVGYAVYGIFFQVVYGAMLFAAIGKFAAPLVGFDRFEFSGETYPIEYLLIPVIGLVVLTYGIAGGLQAAYYTDLIQGLCIIVLSVLLVPFGLQELLRSTGAEEGTSLVEGFRVMHQRIAPEFFQIVGGGQSEFPWYRILAVVIINLVGVVVQPHFIATGGGSAKTEYNARIGLVVGNFLKRFCTIGWVLTALIALALYAGRTELVEDPDKVWGFASLQILGPLKLGLVGLMLACLLAALMSSIDAYMVVGSGLIVRNVYAAYINPEASERECLLIGRLTGVGIVAMAVGFSLVTLDVFTLLQLTWIVTMLFAAPFWVGMYWRRATKWAAWLTVLYVATTFFILPVALPWALPGLRTNQTFSQVTEQVEVTTQRVAAISDVSQRAAEREVWQQHDEELKRLEASVREVQLGETPTLEERKAYLQLMGQLVAAQEKQQSLGPLKKPLAEGELFSTTRKLGGKPIFWTKGVQPVDEGNEPISVDRVVVAKTDGAATAEDAGEDAGKADGPSVSERRLQYPEGTRLRGQGNFRLDLLAFHYLFGLMGLDLSGQSDAVLQTMELPFKIVGPFIVMILLSLVTPRNSRAALDRYYSKMKTPVDPDPVRDQENLKRSLERVAEFEQQKLFPHSSLEFQRPSLLDVGGFLVSFVVCFAIIALAIWVASIGG